MSGTGLCNEANLECNGGSASTAATTASSAADDGPACMSPDICMNNTCQSRRRQATWP